jgi:glycosyltransferase involved in cell wall biosynthesis
MQISVAIPFYNRSKYIRQLLENIAYDERISEIIINDDHSRKSEFQELLSNTKSFSKVRVYRNVANCGPFKNKCIAISKCSNDKAILLDSDNLIGRDYIDAIYKIRDLDSKVIYCPSSALPNFDYSELSGMHIDLNVAKSLFNDEKKAKLFRKFLNTGNFFVDVKNYHACVKNYMNASIHYADVIFLSYLWFMQGNALEVVGDMKYQHRVHDESYQMSWSADIPNTREIARCIRDGSKYEPKINGLFYRFFVLLASQVGVPEMKIYAQRMRVKGFFERITQRQ